MQITDYKKIKTADALNGTANVVVSKVNGTPALTIKKYNPDTGEDTGNTEQIGVDVAALKLKVADMESQVENVNELIQDAEALTK